MLLCLLLLTLAYSAFAVNANFSGDQLVKFDEPLYRFPAFSNDAGSMLYLQKTANEYCILDFYTSHKQCWKMPASAKLLDARMYSGERVALLVQKDEHYDIILNDRRALQLDSKPSQWLLGKDLLAVQTSDNRLLINGRCATEDQCKYLLAANDSYVAIESVDGMIRVYDKNASLISCATKPFQKQILSLQFVFRGSPQYVIVSSDAIYLANHHRIIPRIDSSEVLFTQDGAAMLQVQIGTTIKVHHEKDDWVETFSVPFNANFVKRAGCNRLLVGKFTGLHLIESFTWLFLSPHQQ